MAVNRKEKRRIETHSIDENAFKKDDFIYLAPNGFDAKSSIKKGLNSLSDHPLLMLLSVPQALVLGAFLLFMRLAIISYNNSRTVPVCVNYCNPTATFIVNSIMLAIYAAVGFVLYELVVSSQIGAYCKTRIAGLKKAGIIETILSELSVAQPFCYLLFACGIILAYFSSAVGIGMIVIGIILYFASINQALLPYALSKEKKLNRSAAIAWGWMVLSNFSVRLAYTNITVFLPFIAATLAFMASGSPYLLAALIVLFVPSQAIWYGTTSGIYESSSKSKKIVKV